MGISHQQYRGPGAEASTSLLNASSRRGRTEPCCKQHINLLHNNDPIVMLRGSGFRLLAGGRARIAQEPYATTRVCSRSTTALSQKQGASAHRAYRVGQTCTARGQHAPISKKRGAHRTSGRPKGQFSHTERDASHLPTRFAT